MSKVMVKVVLGVTGVIASIAMHRNVAAKTVMTPFGPADDSCVHEVPEGGKVDAQTGEVRVAGAVVAHHGPCTTSPFVSSVAGQEGVAKPPGSGPGGWYDYVEGILPFSPYIFDEISVNWSVPAAPQVSKTDTSITYIFPSLRNSSQCGTGSMILQPVLQFGIGGHVWTLASYMVYNCNSMCQQCSVAESHPLSVAVGDVIRGSTYQIASNLDEWQVMALDTTSNIYTSVWMWNIPNSWPKFEAAQAGVLEAYGTPTGGPLTSCSQLSPDNGVVFTLNGVWGAGPYWNSFNNDTGSVSWTGDPNPQGLSPTTCAWNYSINSPTIGLSWNHNN